MAVEGSNRRDVHILVGLLVNWFEADNTIAQPPNSMVCGRPSQRAPTADTTVAENNKHNADENRRKLSEVLVWPKAKSPKCMVHGCTSGEAPHHTAIEEDNKINADDLVTQKGPELMVIWLKESIKSILDSQAHHSEDRVHKKAPNSSKSTVFADFRLICLFCHKNIILDDVQIRRKSGRHWLK